MWNVPLHSMEIGQPLTFLSIVTSIVTNVPERWDHEAMGKAIQSGSEAKIEVFKTILK
ncbi:hypothetical protein BH24DEI1_BH24DEI1_18290 [soil metagenome]|jgi:hypothetical protein|nr:hypothetical protein [Deinococcota bacterium]